MSKSSTLSLFRPDFTWGAATASYQLEGACNADGKGPSIWDQFSHWPVKVLQMENGDVACDHYHRMESDVALMSELGLRAYRFSLSWPRILPQGRGNVNVAGLDFYDRLVDALLAKGITPWATLFHWDYPLALYREGGWLHADSSSWFADYTAVVAKKLGDRVKHWITLNEPQVFVKLGHETGLHAPGVKLPVPDLVRITHHVLLAHGRAVQTLRAHGGVPQTIGWSPAVGVSAVVAEYANDPEVVQKARDGLFGLPNPHDFAAGTPVWNDAALLGRYPEAFLKAQAKHLPAGWDADLKVINQPLDFCGLNIYAAWSHHTRDAHGKPVQIADAANALQDPQAGDESGSRPKRVLGSGYPRTLIGWPVTPEALYWGARFFQERYRLPVVITENGMSGHDWVALDGKVHDPHRIDFTTRYLRELRRAAAEGVDVRGYFHWSFMDNFEWAEGYKHRFGLVHVDYQTLKRTPKDSAYWYREVIATNGANL